MSIRNKIQLYFSVVVITLVSIAFVFIYELFAENREEEFQQRQKVKIETTLKFLTEIRDIDSDLIEAMDRTSIHDIYDEKLLIFDRNKQLVYSSIDDTPISFSRQMLDELSDESPWLERKEGKYDVVAVYLSHERNSYYGISKAYDISGYQKLDYLRYTLISTLAGISLIVILVSFYLSRKITHSINNVARQITQFDFNAKGAPAITTDATDEVAILVQRFNELMKRMNEAFAFQKHAVHHISHELKTPIAVLVSNFEKIEKETDITRLHQMIIHQKESTKSLSNIINALLEIAKAESGNSPALSRIRIDELIYDLLEEFKSIHPDFQFSIDYTAVVENENHLMVSANNRLLKAAFSNLMQNCVQHSEDNRASITITPGERSITVNFINHGTVLNSREQQFLFQHFFRGENSKSRSGFGLGLVFIHKIFMFYGGEVSYQSSGTDVNTFTVSLPLS